MSSYGFASGDIRLLHNNFATLANARTGLDDLTRNAAPGDELVFFESSHGYRYPQGDTMVEVLCLYDDFLTDTEFVQRTQVLPPDVLTVVLDACHSGGMNKVFFTADGPALARIKVWTPPNDEALRQVQQMLQVTQFKFFGRTIVAEPADVVKAFSFRDKVTKAFAVTGAATPGVMARWNRKDFNAGDVELNGVLLSACQADQTAAAGSAATAFLSAFTFALTDQLDTGISVSSLCARIVARLDALHMSQTPEVHTPVARPRLASETFVTMQPVQDNNIIPLRPSPPTTPNLSDALSRAFGDIFGS